MNRRAFLGNVLKGLTGGILMPWGEIWTPKIYVPAAKIEEPNSIIGEPGTIFISKDGWWWICAQGGSPGAWRKIAFETDMPPRRDRGKE